MGNCCYFGDKCAEYEPAPLSENKREEEVDKCLRVVYLLTTVALRVLKEKGGISEAD